MKIILKINKIKIWNKIYDLIINNNKLIKMKKNI